MERKQRIKLSKEVLLYVIFGAATTAVNIIVYSLCYNAMGIGNVPSNIAAWVLAVGFAFGTNRRWVFDSRRKGIAVLRESAEFFGGRLVTGMVDLALMYVFVDRMGFDGDVTKLAVNVVVIVLNYLLSKCWIFKK